MLRYVFYKSIASNRSATIASICKKFYKEPNDFSLSYPTGDLQRRYPLPELLNMINTLKRKCAMNLNKSSKTRHAVAL